MQSIFKYILKQAFSFLGILFLGKILFLIYHFSQFKRLNISDQLGIFWHGLKLDISITAYLLIIPILLILLSILKQKLNIIFQKINKYYHLIICIIVSCIITIDLELFRTWGFRIDSTPLKYLKNPSEMWASSAASPFHVLIPLLIALLFYSLFTNRQIFKLKYNFSTKNSWTTFFVILFLWASLIIPIRGGFQLAPINQSSVYFSKNNFANLAAINPVYNFFHSISKKTNGVNPYNYLTNHEAKRLVDSLFYKTEITDYQLVNTKPNILIITLESLTSKILEKPIDVVPNFKKLSKEGIFFENCYASGDRSDKGMVAILSGYPAQPTTSIIQFPQKSAKLPIISRNLKNAGYSTAWYYGGEPEFANMKSYFLTGSFDSLITKENFPEEYTKNTKWGANDSLVFTQLFTDLNKKKQPFFVNYFTLSSHEPFEVAGHQVIKGADETSKFLNAHYYTDQFLGDFIQKAKQTDWYKNTLIIIVADHGHRLPISSKKIDDFKIPMLWIGGALKAKPYVITDICSQNDLAKTLLNQLNISSKEFIWSKDLFAKNYTPFAYFSFNDGFGFVKNDGNYIFDNIGKQVIESTGNNTKNDIKTGQAYLQTSFADYLLK